MKTDKDKIISDLMKEIDDFENRTCENCKSFIWNERYSSAHGTCEEGVGMTFRGVNECHEGFGCNKFRAK